VNFPETNYSVLINRNWIKGNGPQKTLSSEFKSISELRKLLAADCKIEKINPPVFASDAEVNIVTITLVCPDGKTQTIRAYKEEAQSLREFIRTST
jgi:hypothetical protein